MKLYLFLGMSGWWAKLLIIYKCLNKNYENLEMRGLIMAPSVEDELFQKFPEFKNNLDVQYDLVKKFLDNKPSQKEIDFFYERYGNLWKYVIA